VSPITGLLLYKNKNGTSPNSGHRWIHYMHKDEASVLSSGITDVLHYSQYSPDSSVTFYVNKVGTTLNNV